MGKSSAGFVLALIGGIFTIIGSVIMLGYGLAGYFLVQNTLTNADMTGFSDSASPLIILVLGIVGFVWLLIMGILAIVASKKMNKDDYESVRKGGIMAIIVGVLGGSLLTLIGGIVGVVQAKE